MASGLHRWLFAGVDRDRLLDMDRRLALYAAKESGRNRVCPAGTQHPASSPTPQAGLAGAAVGA